MRHSGQTLRIASNLQLQQDITSRQCWETESEMNSVVSEHNGFYCCYLPESSFWTFHLFSFFPYASYESPFLKLITMGSLETVVLSSCARVAGLFPRESIKKSDSCLPPQNPNNISGTVPLLPCSLSQLSVKHTQSSTNCCFSYYLLSLTRGRQTDTPLSVYVSAACPSFT